MDDNILILVDDIKESPEYVMEVFCFISDFLNRWDFAPTHDEIVLKCYLSKTSVGKALGLLEGFGLIMRYRVAGRSIPRGITLTEVGERVVVHLKPFVLDFDLECI